MSDGKKYWAEQEEQDRQKKSVASVELQELEIRMLAAVFGQCKDILKSDKISYQQLRDLDIKIEEFEKHSADLSHTMKRIQCKEL